MIKNKEKKIKKNNLPKAIFLMGPTASGKTVLAINLSKILPVELISVDSALIYQGMDIGTAKPNKKELYETPHRLINIIDPSKTYSVADFRRDALVEMDHITASGKIPLLVGGTMFYFKILLEGISPLPSTNYEIRLKIKQKAETQGWNALYHQLQKIDPITAARIHQNDLQRISRALEIFFSSGKTLTELIKESKSTLPYQVYQFAITSMNQKLIYQKIEKRFYQMLNSGFEEEVQTLFSRGDLHINMPSIRCVGYRQMWSYLQGRISYNEMIYQGIYATKQLAKRQITWLRNWEKVHWLNAEKPYQSLQKIFNIANSIKN